MLDLGEQHDGVLRKVCQVYGSPEAACALAGVDLDFPAISVSRH